MEIVNHHNHNILKSLDFDIDSDEEEDDFFSDDDSVNDPPYKGDEVTDFSSESSPSVDSGLEKNVFRSGGYNPFDSSDEEDSDKNLKSVLNSSVSYNPFDEVEEGENFSTSGGRKVNLCQYCNKSFSNLHNMKLHVIGLVIFKKMISS